MAGKMTAVLVAGSVLLAGARVRAETHAEIQAVDALGNATHPKVIRPGVPWSTDKRVELEGVVLNAPGEIVNTAVQLLIAFQGEGEDHAGTQIWTGSFFQPWPGPYAAYFNIQPGDRIRVSGFAAQFIGKTNINEQHNPDPQRDFAITVLGHPGMPMPEVVPSAAVANTFDPTRTTGGEYYQSRWVRMNGLTLNDPDSVLWQPDEQVTASDGTGNMAIKLSAMGDFAQHSAPTGEFDVVAIFDQEPFPLDFAASRTAHYRLWLKRQAHILAPGAPFLYTAVSRRSFAGEMGSGTFDIDVTTLNAVECRVGGPVQLLVYFDRPVRGQGPDGQAEVTDVAVSSGTVTNALIVGNELTIDLEGVGDALNLQVTFPGITSYDDVAVSQSLCFAVLAGDVTSDRVVNIFDVVAIRNRLGADVDENTFRADVTVDGLINIFDLIQVRNRLVNGVAGACPRTW